jgi:hypothetical protein
MYEDLGEQIVTYNAILDGIDTALAEINKANNLHGLTDLQAQSYLQLKSMYDAMIGDILDLER